MEGEKAITRTQLCFVLPPARSALLTTAVTECIIKTLHSTTAAACYHMLLASSCTAVAKTQRTKKQSKHAPAYSGLDKAVP